MPDLARTTSARAHGGVHRNVSVRAETEQILDGKIEASIVQEAIVRAGVDIGARDVQVRLGTPKLVDSRTTTSADGKKIEREETISVQLLITTKEQLDVFADLLSRTTVEDTKLVLDARAPTVHADVIEEASP